MSDLQYIQDPIPGFIDPQPLCFLEKLQDATVIDISGTDKTRTRVVTVLTHGNEPSGYFALHKWLLEGHQPHTNMRFIISSVKAALKTPIFTHRYMPGEADLNRCFNKKEITNQSDTIINRAKMITKAIQNVSPECVIDLHNTSGSGPAFAVTITDNVDIRALASFFCRRMILTGLNLGSLMEIDVPAPIVTIECGGAADLEAHDVAYHGLREICAAPCFKDGEHHKLVEVLNHPMRVELRDEASLDYGLTHNPDASVTIKSDIEHCNTGITKSGTLLGWVRRETLDNFIIKDEDGVNVTKNILKIQSGILSTAVDVRIFMATTRPDIAKSDCLFYIVPVHQ